MKTILLCLLFPPLAHAVVDGREITFPSSDEDRVITMNTVRLFFPHPNDGRIIPGCTGIAISPREVLTAGHCVAKESNFVSVKSAQGQVRLIRARDFKKAYSNEADLGLLVLDEDLPHVQSLPLAYSGCDDRRRVQSGFGLMASGNTSSKANMSIYEEMTSQEIETTNLRDEDSKYLAKFASRSDLWMTMRSRVGRACLGDSGSPIFCRSQGRLALAAISASIISESLSPRQGKYVAVELCRRYNMLFANRINNAMTVIERWRNPPAPPSDSDDETLTSR